jgi:cytochrome c-type biogenesis protein
MLGMQLPAPDLASPFAAVPVLFAAGVLTSLTPCVYPMIPITVALVGGQAGGGRRAALRLTIAYVVGLALVYAALGVAAGMTGTLFGTVSTNPWLQLIMANLLLVFALALLNVIPVRVPQWVLRRASEAGARGGATGAFAMGAASGLVAAPCGAPVMAGVLTWVATTRSASLGFVYLFVFSLGMCAVLVAAGLSAGLLARLPKAGAWMLWAQRALAVILLAMAEYYLVQMGRLSS